MKRSSATELNILHLDHGSHVPLFRQLYSELRSAILTARIAPGKRLPSTRTLADDLGVSRNTVVNAFEQLFAEGYLEGKVGAGTFVSAALPDDLRKQMDARPKSSGPRPGRRISKRGELLSNTMVTAPRLQSAPVAFRPGLPALDLFPFDQWGRLLAQCARRLSASSFGYGQPAGYAPLKEAIAGYLRASRGLSCGAEQVLIIAGSQQALDLSARVLLDPGDPVCIENPGYIGARAAMAAAGAKLVPVPLDDEGFSIKVAARKCRAPKLIYVTPSHQYPLGVTMSLPRRLALLEWASRAGAWILEDDYDSEFRYDSRPIAALQGLDNDARVIYSGTFSKVLFPSLRLGYLVLPSDLLNSFVAARALIDRHAPVLEQAALAEFIHQGYFARHIRRMRSIYGERQEMLLHYSKQYLEGLLTVTPTFAGMHTVGWLPDKIHDVQASNQAAAEGIDVSPISAYCIEPIRQQGLMLGYAAVDRDVMKDGILKLARALRLSG